MVWALPAQGYRPKAGRRLGAIHRRPGAKSCLDIADGGWCLFAMSTVVRQNRLWWRTF